MSIILGISPHFINNAVALLVDGQVKYACEEERLSREKKTRRFPTLALRDLLARTGLSIKEVDIVGLSVNAGIYLENFDSSHSKSLRYRGEMLYSTPSHIMRLMNENEVSATRQRFDFFNGSKLELEWVEHHLAHAASSFFLSPFETSAILSVDGFGEKTCVLFAHGKGNTITPIFRQEFPHSIGSFYATITELLGFQPHEDEWKLMGASPYGDSQIFYARLRDLFNLKDDGTFELDLSYFNYYQFHRPHMYSPKLLTYLGIQPNTETIELKSIYYDLAAAAQKVTEEVMMHMLYKLHKITGEEAVCLSGGVAFNSVINGKIVSQTPFQQVFIPPMPDDSGTSLGAALYIHHQLHNQPRCETIESNYFGPGYSNDEIEKTLRRFGIYYEWLEDPAAMAAQLIANGKIIGWFQGNLEFGDRALGNRSILADPRDARMKNKVNETIKYREKFRPFAPSMLVEHLNDYFLDATPAPFMEKVFMIHPDKHSVIPAVTHIDGTGRLQTVTKKQNALFYDLIYKFWQLTKVPIVLNTSFNLKGEPIVCSPQDAIRTFFTSGLDFLIMGNFLVKK